MTGRKEASCWEPVKEFMGENEYEFARHLAYIMLHSPRRLLHIMSYYKFAAKLIGEGKNVLDVGCGEGLGTWLLAKECGSAMGIDLDTDAIAAARANLRDPRISFTTGDFRENPFADMDAVVSFDVIEHILPEKAEGFLKAICAALKTEGVAVVGTPNIVADIHASPVTKAGHVNLYSGERLEAEMLKHFHHVFMFGANDEVVHTGFLPMAHYLIAVGARKRS